MPRGRRSIAPDMTGIATPAGNTRANEERRERRRVRGATAMSGQKLTVDESKLDRKRYAYRWVKDQGARMPQMHAEDWDIDDSGAVVGNQGLGTVGSKIGGTDDNGKPYSMVLMRKERDWFESDRKEKQAVLDEIDNSIRRGTVHHKNEADLGEDVSYTPGGSNTISR